MCSLFVVEAKGQRDSFSDRRTKMRLSLRLNGSIKISRNSPILLSVKSGGRHARPSNYLRDRFARWKPDDSMSSRRSVELKSDLGVPSLIFPCCSAPKYFHTSGDKIGASASRGQAIGKVSDIKLIVRFRIINKSLIPKLGGRIRPPSDQTTRR